MECGCEVFALLQFAISFFSTVQFLQHVTSFDLVVLIRPLSGLESGCEVFLPYCSLLLVLLCYSIFCSILLLLMWLFCLGLYEFYFSLLKKACNGDNL